MFLLITGASGMGKSTVRTSVASLFGDRLDAAELVQVAGPPEWIQQQLPPLASGS